MSRTPIESPMRSLLFVPGHDARMIEKALASRADAVILDLEDTVAGPIKDAAGTTAASAIQNAPAEHPPIFVRINKGTKGYSSRDVEGTLSRRLTGFVLPKSESPQAIKTLCRRLDQKEKSLLIPRGTIRLILLIETALGLVRLEDLLRSNERVIAIAFGAEDFCLDAELTRGPEDRELLYARSRISIFARAWGRMAIDCVFTGLKNPEGLLREAANSRNLGFSGKLAIHPNQINTIHQAFAPSKAELAQARKVLAAFAEAEKDRRAVCVVDGKMIDRPIVERARKMLRGR